MIFIRYGFVAGFAYLIDFGGFLFLFRLGCAPLVANALIKIIAAIFGFFSHRRFTYSIKGMDGAGKHAARYFGMALIYTPISSVLLYCILSVLANIMYAKAISDISLFLLMFWITSKFTFTSSKGVSRK